LASQHVSLVKRVVDDRCGSSGPHNSGWLVKKERISALDATRRPYGLMSFSVLAWSRYAVIGICFSSVDWDRSDNHIF
jgi:hypothetical protein